MLVEGAPLAAADAASRLGIPVIPVGTARDGRDAFEPGDLRSDSEVALVLHTSGTTSRSKIVPLTHANLCASARNIARALELGLERSLSQRHAVVSCARTAGGTRDVPVGRRRDLSGSISRRDVSRLASRPPPDLVQRGPVDACGGCRSNDPARRRHDEPHAPLHPVRIGAAGPESDGSPRGPLRRCR